MIHNFEDSLRCEHSKAACADNFYRHTLRALDIVRYNTGSESDMDYQRKDIDLTLTIHDGIRCHVSEKFRNADFGDLYVEVFSKYPYKPGWIHTGSPDLIAYFTHGSFI